DNGSNRFQVDPVHSGGCRSSGGGFFWSNSRAPKGQGPAYLGSPHTVCGKDRDESSLSNCHSPLCETLAPPVNGAADSFLSGVIAHAQRLAHSPKIELLEVAEQQGLALLIAQLRHRFVERRTNAFPVLADFRVDYQLFHGLPFLRDAAAIVANQ